MTANEGGGVATGGEEAWLQVRGVAKHEEGVATREEGVAAAAAGVAREGAVG